MCSFLLYNKVSLLYVYIHPLCFGFPSHLGHHKVMSRVPCTIYYVLIQFSSVAQSCPTLCDPMNRNMPGLPVHHQLPESTQTHVHRVDDAIQPSHPPLYPSPLALNLS